MIEFAGFLSAALIGISLGSIGGGGSILTVPMLVYLFHLSPLTATSYSLFVVGSTSFVGAYNNYRHNLVHLPTVVFFGSASVVTVFSVRRFLIPLIPADLLAINSYTIRFDFLTMILFALLMMAAAVSMIRSKGVGQERVRYSRKRLLCYGVGIGLLTGFLGVGGGFLLIPALVLFLGLDMKKAVGTSLFIIGVNSLIGFCGDLGHSDSDWRFLLLLTAIAVSGIFIGGRLTKFIRAAQLKKGFGWFVLGMAVLILTKEILSF